MSLLKNCQISIYLYFTLNQTDTAAVILHLEWSQKVLKPPKTVTENEICGKSKYYGKLVLENKFTKLITSQFEKKKKK